MKFLINFLLDPLKVTWWIRSGPELDNIWKEYNTSENIPSETLEKVCLLARGCWVLNVKKGFFYVNSLNKDK